MEKSRHTSTADMDKLRKGIQYPDELVGLPEDEEHKVGFVNKNDPQHDFVPIDRVPDENHFEDEIAEKLDQEEKRKKVRLAEKVLKFIETIEPAVKDKEMLKKYTQSPDRINPQGRWEASEEEISRINEFILKLGLNSRFNLKSRDLLKEFSQMSPDDLAKVKQAIIKFIESNPLDGELDDE